MQKKEKNLIIVALVIFAAFLVVRVRPMIMNYYQQGQDEIALLEQRIDQYRNLILETGRWAQEEQEMQQQVADLQTWVFPGSDPNLIGNSMQREIRRIVDATNVTFREMSSARPTPLEGWVRVDQELSFIIDQDQMLPFLNELMLSRPRLFVTEISFSRSRRQFTGNITVTGFSKDV